jgi:hypothetical protein
MGLLDEAIREHLELKRRAGADPSLVAREEQEALAPVLRDDPDGLATADAEAGPEGMVDAEPVDCADPEPVPAYEPEAAHQSAHEPAGAEQPAAMPMLSEETQELDMVAAMADEPGSAEDDDGSPTWSLAKKLQAAEDAGGEPVYGGFDWDEGPGDGGSSGEADEIPGQERLSFE